VAVTGEEANALSATAGEQKAVVLDLVNPVSACWRSLSGARQARLYEVGE
jgi:hypothetical protein